jgi:hypothetical protein
MLMRSRAWYGRNGKKESERQLRRYDVGWDLCNGELSFVSGGAFGLQTDARVL